MNSTMQLPLIGCDSDRLGERDRAVCDPHYLIGARVFNSSNQFETMTRAIVKEDGGSRGREVEPIADRATPSGNRQSVTRQSTIGNP